MYEAPRVVKFTDTESRVVVASVSGEGRMRSYYLMGAEFQYEKMKIDLEMEVGDGCTTM